MRITLTEKARLTFVIAPTKGNKIGHYFRRLVHISLCVIPLLYYSYKTALSAALHLDINIVLWTLLAVVILLEGIRLKLGWVVFGQREYEARQISAFAWGSVGIILVLLFSPGLEFSLPIIWSLAFADPILGESRRYIKQSWVVNIIGLVVLLIIWWGCAYWFSFSLWWGVILAPLTGAVESLRLKWIDDNALILLVPLFIVMIGRSL